MKELFEAVRAGDLARVQTLVDADPTLAIFAAAILGDTERLEELLTGNRSLVSALSSDGWTPLHLAAFFGKDGAVRLLLNKGASVTARSTNQMANTPLHAAAAGKHADVVKVLLAHGADIQARSDTWSQVMAVEPHGYLPYNKSIPAGNETALETPAQHLIDDGDLFGEAERVVQRHDEAHRADAKPLGSRAAGDRVKRG